ncbi:MAG: glycoside hydrolase family 13 protein, partial [Acidimicrobiia bacterium]|nr:glycoside hydrolase family 13 protein [Acidimicrobiia bacterium]
MNLVAAPHHDGSALFVDRVDWRVGGVARVRLRVPNSAGLQHAAVRYTHDGEQGYQSLARDDEQSSGTATPGNSALSWWSATLPLTNPVVSYRFVLAMASGETRWLNATGVHTYDTPDADDFVVRCDITYPEWPTSSVVYQIFPDRFATSGLEVSTPSWARRREWGTLPQGPDWSSELFGGDLYGAAEHLDHVAQLGANVVYFTPMFTARSAHRYDAETFDEIDPLLGGDAGFAAMSKQAHAWNMRVLGDLTLNHCGASHAWYEHAVGDKAAPEREYFYFEQTPEGEKPATWLGVSSLIKLNFASQKLRQRMYAAADSIAKRWLDSEIGLDGWRIDVANMAGRRGAHDVSHDVSNEFVAACQQKQPDTYVVGEHFPDPRADMVRGGWHGIMAYSAFTRPVWGWLRGETLPAGFPDNFFGTPFGVPQRDGVAMVAAMRAFTAGVP